ncbi:MAG: WD40 repeat domain-containing protein [Polyangiales bacterium]
MSSLTRDQKSTELGAVWRAQVGDYTIALASSRRGDFIAAATGAGDIIVWEATNGGVVFRERAHGGGAMSLAWSPTTDILATSGQDGTAKIFSAKGELLATLPSNGWVEHVAWSPDGRWLATAAGKQVRIWTREGAPHLETESHPSTVSALRWSHGTNRGRQLATACYGGVHLWDVASGARAKLLGWKGSLVSLAWSPDDKIIAGGAQDNSVHFWRVSTGRDAQMSGYPFKPTAIAWDAQSTLLATSGDATVTVWNFSGKGPEGSRPIQLAGHKAQCTTLAFSPRKGILASGGQDTGILLWEPKRTHKPIAFAFLDDFVTSLVWHPEHRLLVGGDAAGTVCAFATG